MPEYLAPGVFIEEIERGPKPIEGVATSTAAFVGETARGPLKPTLITSYSDYLRTFGGQLGEGKHMPNAVKAFFDNGGRRCYIARVHKGKDTASSTIAGLTIKARGPGTSGENIAYRLNPGSTRNATGSVGFKLELFYESLTSLDASAATIVETFDDLSVDPSSPDYFIKRVNNGNSALIELSVDAKEPSPIDLSKLLSMDNVNNVLYLTLKKADDQGSDQGNDQNTDQGSDQDGDQNTNQDGDQSDAKITVNDYIGVPVSGKLVDVVGLEALNLDAYRDVAIVYAPHPDDSIAVEVANAVITHCENNRFRFAVIDCPANQANISNLNPRDDIADSKYAAYYYPWVVTNDATTGEQVKIPPGGAVCGIYARTDTTRGVFKAPANEAISGALDLEFDIDQGRQEILNPRGVNVIRRFPGRGIRVWGARTLSSDPLWKYVNVRRLFIFLEASIYNSTQWVVFEPNDQRLWARVKQTVTLFLRSQWQEGALFGAKEEEAFSVNIGRETMTQDDILNGRLIAEIGIAPVRPAEFVVFRVFQKTQESNS